MYTVKNSRYGKGITRELRFKFKLKHPNAHKYPSLWEAGYFLYILYPSLSIL